MLDDQEDVLFCKNCFKHLTTTDSSVQLITKYILLTKEDKEPYCEEKLGLSVKTNGQFRKKLDEMVNLWTVQLYNTLNPSFIRVF